jgi:hypothetical protein
MLVIITAYLRTVLSAFFSPHDLVLAVFILPTNKLHLHVIVLKYGTVFVVGCIKIVLFVVSICCACCFLFVVLVVFYLVCLLLFFYFLYRRPPRPHLLCCEARRLKFVRILEYQN